MGLDAKNYSLSYNKPGIDWTSIGRDAVGGATTGASLGPWTAVAGGVLGAVGSGITAAEEAEKEKERLRMAQEQFDWQKTMDKKGQFNTERQLGQNTLAGMRGGFREALRRALVGV